MAVIWNRWAIVITLLVITVLYVRFVPLGEGTALRKDLSLFPADLDEWVQIKGGETVEFDALPPAEFYISRTYKNNKNEPVSLYIGYRGKFRHGVNVFGGRYIAPGKNWEPNDSSDGKIDVGRRSIRIHDVSYKNGNNYVLVTYWYFMGDQGVMGKGMGRIKYAVSAILNQRTDVALIKVSSTYHSPEETGRHKALHLRFIQEMAPRLPEFLPYEL